VGTEGFTARLAVMLLEIIVSERSAHLTDEGMVTAFQLMSNKFLHQVWTWETVRKTFEKALELR
jgi:hypothetical protein